MKRGTIALSRALKQRPIACPKSCFLTAHWADHIKFSTDTNGFCVHEIVRHGTLRDQAVKGIDPTLGFAATEDLGPMHVQSRQISPGASALVFMFDFHRDARLGRESRMESVPGLNTGLLIGRDHEFVLLRRLVLPLALVEIQNASGFGGKIRVARKNPTAMLPGANGVLMEPAPEGRVAERSDQARLADMLSQFAEAPTGQRLVVSGRQLARQGLNLHDQFWGEKTGGGPVGSVPPAPPSAP